MNTYKRVSVVKKIFDGFPYDLFGEL